VTINKILLSFLLADFIFLLGSVCVDFFMVS
jgi:hypothetical protein